MPSCKFSDPSYPLATSRDKSDDLDGLWGDNEEEIFRGINLTNLINDLDFNDLDLSLLESSYDSENDSDGECVNSKFREARNHDCMWSGQCCNKELLRTLSVPVVPPPKPAAPAASTATPSVVITHSSHKVVTIQKCVPAGKCSERTDVVVVTNNVNVRPPVANNRSLLLNRTTLPQPTPSPAKTPIKREVTPHSSRPETPQSLVGDDDDGPILIDSHNTTNISRILLDAVHTAPSYPEWEDDLMFGSVKRTKEEKAPVPSQTDILRLSACAKSDHNYDGSSKNFSLEGLGVDTPSDSEEEIDVVSLSERSSSSRSSSCGGLPTRPTQRDQETLEELLSASEAVSRKLKKTISSHQVRHKRKKYQSDSSDDDDDEDEEEEEEFCYVKYHQPTKKRKSNPPSQRRKKVSRFGEEEDSQEKRDLHNNMERMRRIDLRNSFEELKALVPGLASKDRAAKVVILREAANYCDELGAESQSKCMQVMALRKEQERLRSMVSSLRKAAAMAKKRY